jgi:hypothetical protein
VFIGGGNTSTGDYTISGGSLNQLGSDGFIIGNSGTATGILRVSGSGNVVATNNLNVGNNGTGRIEQSGGNVDAGSLMIAANSGSTGSYEISGGELFVAGRFSVGSAFGGITGNSATFTVNGGAATISGDSFEADGEDVTVAFNVGSDGISTINVVTQAFFDDTTIDMGTFGGFVPTNGDTFDLITAGGGFTGTFMLAPEDQDAWSLSIDGMTLSATFIPEPGSVALLGLGGLTLLRRRRA